MSDPTGLRALLRAYALATSNVYWEPEEWTDLPEYGTLDAALIRVETLVQAAEALSTQHEQDALDFYHGLSGRLPRYAGEIQAIRDALATVRERGVPEGEEER